MLLLFEVDPRGGILFVILVWITRGDTNRVVRLRTIKKPKLASAKHANVMLPSSVHIGLSETVAH